MDPPAFEVKESLRGGGAWRLGGTEMEAPPHSKTWVGASIVARPVPVSPIPGFLRHTMVGETLTLRRV